MWNLPSGAPYSRVQSGLHPRVYSANSVAALQILHCFDQTEFDLNIWLHFFWAHVATRRIQCQPGGRPQFLREFLIKPN